MVRPMFLNFPLDAACQGADVEDQFMFGAQWLVAPVTAAGVASRSVYLPLLNETTEWIYYFNFSSVGRGGARVDVPTPISEFPLFFMRPVTPPPPPPPAPTATTLFSAERADTVLCLANSCFEDNVPSNPGAYAEVRVEGTPAAANGDPGSVVVDGVTYKTVPLTLFYSDVHSDNFVSTNVTAPDSSYTVTFGNGAAFAAPPPPGALRVQYFFKRGAGAAWDYFTCASAAGVAWAQANGYADVSASVPVAAFLLPAA